jgi:hypothetical protein
MPKGHKEDCQCCTCKQIRHESNIGQFKKEQTSWNKGLTKETNEKVRQYGENGSVTKLGKHSHHSEE